MTQTDLLLTEKIIDRYDSTLQDLGIPKNLSNPMVYLFLRTDLKRINPGYEAIQLAHAAYQMGLEYGSKNPRTYHKDPTTFCVFEVPNESELFIVQQSLAANGYRYNMFMEPDWNTGATAIACEPVSGQRREFFSQFKLYNFAPKRLTFGTWLKLFGNLFKK
jgi:hypothetical protein